MPRGIIQPYSDFYLHRLDGDPSEVLGRPFDFSFTEQNISVDVMRNLSYRIVGHGNKAQVPTGTSSWISPGGDGEFHGLQGLKISNGRDFLIY